MAENSKIEWTDHTFNPWRGCTKVSAGCAHCYAETMSKRNPKVLGVWGDNGTRVKASKAMWKEPLKWNEEAAKTGKRVKVFCASLADVFEDRPELIPWRLELFRLIRKTQNLEWMLLTKRPENWSRLVCECAELADQKAGFKHMFGHDASELDDPESAIDRDFLTRWIAGGKPSNVSFGTSVEDQRAAEARIPELFQVPAKVLFISLEPMLGPVDLGMKDHRGHRQDYIDGTPWPQCLDCSTEEESVDWFRYDGPRLDFVIVGGESGPGARPMHPDWVRLIRDQCAEAGVAFFFKQWGEWAPWGKSLEDTPVHNGYCSPIAHTDFAARHRSYGTETAGGFSKSPVTLESEGFAFVARVGKKAAGATLDGRTHREFPPALHPRDSDSQRRDGDGGDGNEMVGE